MKNLKFTKSSFLRKNFSKTCGFLKSGVRISTFKTEIELFLELFSVLNVSPPIDVAYTIRNFFNEFYD